MSRPREIELKLELTPTEAVRMREKGFGETATPPVPHRLVSVYFDTRKQALRKKGLTLRVRSDGERRVQTVKANDRPSAGMFDRAEWESDIVGDAPDLEAAAASPAGEVLRRRKRARPLAPVFETVIDRTVWQVERGGAEIELALDEGRVVADGSARPFAELELELKRGSPSDLFAFVRSLDAAKLPRIGVLTKSERGYALAGGDSPTAFKAEPVALDPTMSTADAFRAVATTCIRQFRLNEAPLVETRAPEALHQARVAIRRLRAALSAFGSALVERDAAPFKKRLKAVSDQLGAARNLDVYLARAHIPENGGEGGPEASAARERLTAERDRAYDRVIATLEGKRFRRFMLDLVAWVEVGAWQDKGDPARRAACEEPVAEFATRILKGRLHKLQKKGRHLARLDPAKRHRVRIAAKKLRYVSEFFASLADDRKHRGRHKALLAALEGLQSSLGELNDLEAAREIEAGLAIDPLAVLGESGVAARRDADSSDLIETGQKAAKRLAAVKPFWNAAGR